jgi:hypothetical protein
MLYNVSIIIFKPKVNTIQNYVQANFVRCQRFIYDYKNVPVVMIGSSMSAKIEQEILPDWIYNLSFAGGGVLTGLEILVRSKANPHMILLETNLIDTSKDNELLKRLYKPILWHLRKHFIFLQSEYQPLNLLMSLLRESIGQGYENKVKNRKVDPNIVKSMLDINEKRFSYKPDLDQKMIEINRLIHELNIKKPIVVFYEMPIHPKLTDSVRMVSIRSKVKSIAEENNYLFLALPDSSQYETVDSIHMTYDSINKYLKVLLKNIEKTGFSLSQERQK